MLLSAPAIFGPHQTIGFEIQQRDGSGEKQSNTRKQHTGFQIAIAWVHKKWRETPKEQRRRWNADRDAQPGQHPSQSEVGEHEAGAKPKHRREGEENRCGDGCCPA
jgi:hypothetical protein